MKYLPKPNRMQLPKRGCSGNMLLLMLSVTTILVMLLSFAFSYTLTCHDQIALQGYGDSAALKGAIDLNTNDRAEQINNLVARSRELVFNARLAVDNANSSHQYLQPLAYNLLMLSRNGASRVIDEKRRLIKETLTALTTANKSVPKEDIEPGFLMRKGPRLLNLEVGYLDNQNSNVSASPGNALLFAFDQNAKCLKKGSNLYLAQIPLKLISADNDLDFSLSPMPSSSDGQPVQAKLTAERDFRRFAYLIKDGQPQLVECREFPSALKMTFSQPVKMTGNLRTVLMTSVVASTASVAAPP